MNCCYDHDVNHIYYLGPDHLCLELAFDIFSKMLPIKKNFSWFLEAVTSAAYYHAKNVLGT